jgi:hypothetical protein
MATLLPNYPSPVVICTVTGGATGLQPGILDIETFRDAVSGYPPVLQVIISGTGTVVVTGALQVSQTNPATLIDPTDVSAGGFTASDFYDLIPGIRFYQINVTANNATVTVKAAFGQLLRMMNNAPQGT